MQPRHPLPARTPPQAQEALQQQQPLMLTQMVSPCMPTGAALLLCICSGTWRHGQVIDKGLARRYITFTSRADGVWCLQLATSL